MRVRVPLLLRSCTFLIVTLLLPITSFNVLLDAADRGEIAGTVVDNSGAVMPGVTVTLTGPERRTAVTNDRGEFAFYLLLPGVYETRIELAGFKPEQSKVAVSAGGTVRLKITLEVGAMTETVTVSADQMPLNVSSTRPGPRPSVRRSFHTEAYDSLEENPFRRVNNTPRSTFSIDVDTASYANVRRFLNEGGMPPAGAVRIEELINYFHFDYAQPTSDAPFSVTTETAACPWNPSHTLALIGLQGRKLSNSAPPASNLVFLVDTSGSMDEDDKLPLVQAGLRMLAQRLTARDRVAIVTYAGSTRIALPSTPGDEKETIDRALTFLNADGSTNGGAGIMLAYGVARDHFIPGGVNRVILATDGDFNVGLTSHDELVKLIETQRESGIYLSVLGVGTGNLKDSTMEMLADKGNGNYSYLDSLLEARRVLVREAGSTLVTIANDVKIQVEFNPRTVAAYRLIGYENRLLKDEDFNDDTKDAGEIGAGHSVTALYEIVPVGAAASAQDQSALGGSVDALKYQRPPERSAAAASDEFATIKLRYKQPNGAIDSGKKGWSRSRLLTQVVSARTQPMSANLGFASAVAEFGMLLRGSAHVGSGSYASLVARARTFRGEDPEGDRAGFIALAELASSLSKMGSSRSASASASEPAAVDGQHMAVHVVGGGRR